MITFRGQKKVKENSLERVKFFIWFDKLQEKPLKIKIFNRICRSDWYPITSSCSFRLKFFIKKFPSIALVCPLFLRRSLLFCCTVLFYPLNFNPLLISSSWLRAKLALTWMGQLEYHTWHTYQYLLSYSDTYNILLNPLHFYVYISTYRVTC